MNIEYQGDAEYSMKSSFYIFLSQSFCTVTTLREKKQNPKKYKKKNLYCYNYTSACYIQWTIYKDIRCTFSSLFLLLLRV